MRKNPAPTIYGYTSLIEKSCKQDYLWTDTKNEGYLVNNDPLILANTAELNVGLFGVCFKDGCHDYIKQNIVNKEVSFVVLKRQSDYLNGVVFCRPVSTRKYLH